MNSEFTRSQAANPTFSQEDFAQALNQYDYQFQKGQVVRGKIFELGSEGAYVDIGGKSSGFVPAKEAGLRRVRDLSEVLPLHEDMNFLVISEQNADGQVTLSRRQMELNEAWDELLERQASGKSVELYVTGTNRGGVTGEVNGLRGFIPRSHLVEQQDLESLVGQTLTADFLEVDRENNKLVLSQRQAARAAAMNQLIPGSLVTGTVANIKPYGVFVNLNGATGLLHIKQISQKRIESLENLFQIRQQIKVTIVEIDEWKGRISLSTKNLESYPGELLENWDEVMATAEERHEKAKAQAESDSQ